MKTYLSRGAIILGVAILTSCGAVQNSNENTNLNNNTNLVSVNSNMNEVVTNSNQNILPQSSNIRGLSIGVGATVTSPLNLTGEAKGWFFEGSFPMTIKDANGKVLFEGAVPSTEDWMQEGFIPFKTRAFFTTPTADTGTITLMNDNPSGLPENSEQYVIPVKFGVAETTAVQLFFQSTVGLPACGMVSAVQREVPKVPEVGTRALEELLAGPTTTENGVITTIPNGTTLQHLAIVEGKAEVDLISAVTDLNSCQKTTMRAQIEQTLKQFPNVSRVEVRINGVEW